MAESARRAGRRPERDGAPNAVFIASSVEALPEELSPIADRVTIHFPWGALLRGVICAEREIVSPIARIARPGAVVRILVSVTDTERATGLTSLDRDAAAAVAPAFGVYGLELVTVRRATEADVREAHSTWAKRLGAGTRREAWLLEFIRRV